MGSADKGEPPLNSPARLSPPGLSPADWQTTLSGIADTLTATCRAVDPQRTDEMLEELADEA